MQVLIALDQLVNAAFARGMADETLSARIYRNREKGAGWAAGYKFVNGLFFWQIDHCGGAYLSELNRKQLPKEYRNG